MKAFLVLVLVASNAASSLSQTSITLKSNPPALVQEKLAQRREMARDLLRVLGLEGYPPLDPEHARELVGKMREWAVLGTQIKPEPSESSDVPKGLYPNQWERWGRFHQIKIEGTEQPKTIVVQQGGIPTPIVNPDRALYKFSLTVKPSEFFPTSADVSAQLQAFKDAGNTQVGKGEFALCKPDVSRPPSSSGDLVGCLSKTRRKDVFYRGISGLSGILSGGRNPQLQQGLLVDPGSAAAKRNFQFSGQVDWDPTTLFPTGSDWRNAQSSAAFYKDGAQQFTTAVRKRCGLITGDSKEPLPMECLPKLAGPNRGTFVLAALLPQVEYKVQTQFDFIKSGGGFIAAPFPEGHLWYVSFTTDLRKAIVPMKARTDALAVLRPKAEVNKDKAALILAYSEMSVTPQLLLDDKWFDNFQQTVATVLASQ